MEQWTKGQYPVKALIRGFHQMIVNIHCNFRNGGVSRGQNLGVFIKLRTTETPARLIHISKSPIGSQLRLFAETISTVATINYKMANCWTSVTTNSLQELTEQGKTSFDVSHLFSCGSEGYKINMAYEFCRLTFILRRNRQFLKMQTSTKCYI